MVTKTVNVMYKQWLSIDDTHSFVIPLLEPLFLIPTHMSFEERLRLFDLGLTRSNKFVACEVGSYFGASTAFLAAAASLRMGIIHAVDTWQNQAVTGDSESDTFAEFRQNTRHFSQHIVTHRGFSHEVADQIPKLDLLFIDGDHSYEAVFRDLTHYVPKLGPGAILAMHDYDEPAVRTAASDYFRGQMPVDLGITHHLQAFQTAPAP